MLSQILIVVTLVIAAPLGMIDVGSEPLITLSQLARLLPRRRKDRPTAPSTVHRWRAPGLRGVRLECIRVGGAWCTTLKAFEDFCARLSKSENLCEPWMAGAQGRGTADRDARYQDRVERELDRELG